MKKVGIYSGVFDPIHHGHISFARQAAQEVGLDKIFFMPEPEPRYKHSASDIRHRLNMLWLALKEFEELELLHGAHTQFTVPDTLPWLENQFNDTELYLLMGTDLFNTINAWQGHEWLKSRVKLVVGRRHDEQAAHSISPDHLIATDLSGLSSKTIRQAGDFAQKALVPELVVKYMRAHKLYR